MRVWRCTPFKSSLEKSVSKKRFTFCDRRVQIVYKSSSGSSGGEDAGVESCESCPASAFCEEGDVELVVAAATVVAPPELVLFSMMPLLIPAVASFLICAVVVVVAAVV